MLTRRPNPDSDMGYLLGNFDAGRMIRLEGMPRAVGRLFRDSFTSLQHRYPSADRNITYLSWSLPTEEREFYLARNGGWSFYQLQRLNNSGGRIIIAAGSTSTPILKTWLEERKDDPQLPLTAQRPSRTTAHEHGHTLQHELFISDQLLGTTITAELQRIVHDFVPGYSLKEHKRQALAASAGVDSRDLPIIDAFVRQGIGKHVAGYKTEPFTEVLAEAFSNYVHGSTTPLCLAIGQTFERFCARDSPARKGRERAILETFSHNIPVDFDLNASKAPTALIQAAQEDRDPRFAYTALESYVRKGVLLGSAQMSLLPDLAMAGIGDPTVLSLQTARSLW